MIAADEFKAAQRRLLERYRIDAEPQFIEVPAVRGHVHVLRSGTGPPVVMVPGFADPAAMWAALMAGLEGSAPRGCAAARRAPGGAPLEGAPRTDSASRSADLGLPRCVRRAERGWRGRPGHPRRRVLPRAWSGTYSLGRTSR